MADPPDSHNSTSSSNGSSAGCGPALMGVFAAFFAIRKLVGEDRVAGWTQAFFGNLFVQVVGCGLIAVVGILCLLGLVGGDESHGD